MSYLGGADKGYEAGRLGVGMSTTKNISKATEVQRMAEPVLSAKDKDARWYDNKTIFKSSVIHDVNKKSSYPFLMYYNSAGDSSDVHGDHFESISIAVSNDMQHWKRWGSACNYKGQRIWGCPDAKIGRCICDVYFITGKMVMALLLNTVRCS